MEKPNKFECEKCCLFVGRTRAGEPICGSPSHAQVNLCKLKAEKKVEEYNKDILIMIESLGRAIFALIQDDKNAANEKAQYVNHLLMKMTEEVR